MGTATTKLFEFRQNNSGGHFDIDDAKGIGPRVYIEAVDVNHATSRAESLGLYFDGVESGSDCECCGDRWSPPWDDGGVRLNNLDPEYAFMWHDKIYVHRLDGEIERLTSDLLLARQSHTKG